MWHVDKWPNFSPEEFVCKCDEACEFKDAEYLDTALVDMLQRRRDQLERPIIVLSALRCPVHNFDIDGAPNSQHKEGKAVDYTYSGIDVIKEAQWLQQREEWKGGIYAYVGRGFIHFDTGPLQGKNTIRQALTVGHLDRPIPKIEE